MSKAEVRGFYFKSMIGGLLTASVLFPEIAQRVKSIGDDDWVPWPEYLEAIAQISATLSEQVVRTTAIKLMIASMPFFEARGHTGPESIFATWNETWEENIRGTSRRERMWCTHATPGHVLFEMGLQLSGPFSQGIAEGIVHAYKQTIENSKLWQEHTRHPVHRVELRYRKRATSLPWER